MKIENYVVFCGTYTCNALQDCCNPKILFTILLYMDTTDMIFSM